MRFSNNPLITSDDLKPSRDDFEIICVFNAGATVYNGEILLLLRVAERPVSDGKFILVPVVDLESEQGGLKILEFDKNDPEVDASDPRVVKYKGIAYLTSISHLRIARSSDGMNFTIDDKPFIAPERREEEFGVEDPRITQIDGTYAINYTAVSSHGIATSLITTTDFKTYHRKGIVFPPTNRDVAIFSEKVNGQYITFHRPSPKFIGRPSMWLAFSDDLIKWGEHKLLMTPEQGRWDSIRIGAGPPPIKTDKGWLEIYHGVADDETYSLGLLLLDLEDPSKILYRSPTPFLAPEEDYEKIGFVKNVIFSNGLVHLPDKDDEIIIYYGAADKYLCGAKFHLDEILKKCGV